MNKSQSQVFLEKSTFLSEFLSVRRPIIANEENALFNADASSKVAFPKLRKILKKREIFLEKR